MLLIREKSVCLLATVALLSGCGLSAHRQNSPPVQNTEPVVADEAMQRRDWAQATAIYPNGAVAAGPTQFNYEPRRGMPDWKYDFADSATFFANMALLPYNLYKHPQGSTVISPGETIGPTFTAQPLLPPATEMEPSTPPVIQNPGAEPTTPPVVEPGAMAPPAPEAPTTPSTDAKPQAPEPAAPAPEAAPAPMPAPAPAPEAAPTAPAPTPAPAETAPAPIQISPAPAPAPSPAPVAPAPEPAPAPGEVVPRTPRVIEPPPPQATKNLAPAIQRAPSTQPDMNK